MKKLFYFSIAIFLLSVSSLIGFHVGNQISVAQTQPMTAAYAVNSYFKMSRALGREELIIDHYVIMSNGDIYTRQGNRLWPDSEPNYVGNFWNKNPIPEDHPWWEKGLRNRQERRKQRQQKQ